MAYDGYEKRIDGRKFYGIDFTHIKEDAQSKAKVWRNKGYKARIIKTREKRDTFFVVYIYPSPGEL